MLNIYDFFGKKIVDITRAISLGNVVGFAFSSRLRKIFYLKTDKNYYVCFNKIVFENDVIVTNSHLSKIEEHLTIVTNDLLVIDTRGKIVGKVDKINTKNTGLLVDFMVNNSTFCYKDVFSLGENIVVVQSEHYIRPTKIQKPKKNSKLTLIYPTKKEDIIMSKLDNNINDKYDLSLFDKYDKDDDDDDDDENEKDNEDDDDKDNDDEKDDDDDKDDNDEKDKKDDEDSEDNKDDEDNNNDDSKDNNDNEDDEDNSLPNNNKPNKDKSDKPSTVILQPVAISKSFSPSTNINKFCYSSNISYYGNISFALKKMPPKIICNKSLLNGKTVKENIYLNNGRCLIKKNTKLNDNIIVIAGKNNKLIDLIKS